MLPMLPMLPVLSILPTSFCLAFCLRRCSLVVALRDGNRGHSRAVRLHAACCFAYAAYGRCTARVAEEQSEYMRCGFLTVGCRREREVGGRPHSLQIAHRISAEFHSRQHRLPQERLRRQQASKQRDVMYYLYVSTGGIILAIQRGVDKRNGKMQN